MGAVVGGPSLPRFVHVPPECRERGEPRAKRRLRARQGTLPQPWERVRSVQMAERARRVLALLIFVVGLGLVAGVLAFVAQQQRSMLERGRRLVVGLGCHECHSPKMVDPEGDLVPDPHHLLAGHPTGAAVPVWQPSDVAARQAGMLVSPGGTAWAGPWGVRCAPNLTPDPETGLGRWSESEFIQAMRSESPARRLAWVGHQFLQAYLAASAGEADDPDADLRAIWRYLRTLPPIRNPVPGWQPFNMERAQTAGAD